MVCGTKILAVYFDTCECMEGSRIWLLDLYLGDQWYLSLIHILIVIAVIDCKTDVDSAFKSNLFVWKLWHRKASF